MRNRIDSNAACTGLVQNYLGSSYDVVKNVYDNLDIIVELENLLGSEGLDIIVENLSELLQLAEQLSQFNDRYYGPLENEPVKRPDGSEIEKGDIYFNTTDNTMYVYTDGGWVPTNSEFVTQDIFVITEEQEKSGKDIVLTLTNSYVPDVNALRVYVNAGYQFSTSNGRSIGSYHESSPTTITFTAGDLEKGDVVAVIRGETAESTLGLVNVKTQYHLTNVEGEKYIKIPGNLSYILGSNNLEIFVDGIRQTNTVDYVETTNTAVTFTKGLPINSLIVFKIGQLVSTNQPIDLVSMYQNVNTADEFYSLQSALDTDVPVYLRGYKKPADGGAGMFLYDVTYPRVSANGGTAIDPSVNLGDQGAGSGNGCWVRQYGSNISSLWFGETRTFISSLNKYGALRDGDVVSIDGYQKVDDGGQGIFYWDEDMPKNAHDGGVVIDPQKLFPSLWNDMSQMDAWFTPNASGYGCWVRSNKSEATIDWFGGDKTGTVDSAYSFKAAFDSINKDNISSLFIPEGRYLINSGTVSLINRKTSLFEITGAGENSIIELIGLASARPFVFKYNNGVRIRNIQFLGHKVEDITPLHFMNCEDVTVSNCFFNNFKLSCIKLTEDLENFNATKCDYFSVVNCKFWDCSTDVEPTINIKPLVSSSGLVIKENFFKNCGARNSSCIYAGTAYVAGRITGNTILGTNGTGIIAEAYDEISITDNYIDEFYDAGIKIIASPTNTYRDASCALCDIRNNRMQLSTPSLTYGIEHGGTLLPTVTTIVMHNLFVNCQANVCSDGSECTNVKVVDNYKTP